MSKISNELRNWCDDPYMGRVDDLYSLADRVDAEMVELPISADGKIWTGREVCFWTGATNEDRHIFGYIARKDGRWYVVEDTGGTRYVAEEVWFERPDSFERIADELDEMVEYVREACLHCRPHPQAIADDREGLSVDSMISDINLVSARALDLAKRIRKLAEKKEG